MQTVTEIIDGTPTEVPVILNAAYLVDFGPTPESGRRAWIEQYRATLTEVGKREFGGLPIPLEVLAVGRYGRTVLRVFAPDPDKAVFAAERLTDGDGPKVAAL